MPSSEPSRRELLLGCATVTSGLLAGCTSRLGGGDPSSTSTIHFQMERIDGSLVDQHVVDLGETRIDWDEEAFEAALNGSDYTTRFRRPFPVRSGDDPAYTEHDGSYYLLDSVVVGEERVTRPVLRLFRVGRRGELEDPPEFVPHEELPTVDRRAVQIAHMAARARGNEGGYPVGLVERGGYVYRSDERERVSRLLGGSAPDHVGFRDVVYRIEVITETFHEPIYRPDVEPVAESEEEMETVLRAVLVDSRFDPESLTQEERRIVQNAIGGGYRETHPFSEPLVSLLEALDRREYIDGNVEEDATIDRTRENVLKYGEEYYDYYLFLES